MIQIGAPVAHDFGNPLGVLSDCHRRVEHFLQLMITVAAQARGGPLGAEQRDALEVALRYFTEAAPKHTEDEEQSLFPRLRASRHARAAQAVAIIELLAEEHEVADAHHEQVEILVRRWLTVGSLADAAARRLEAHLDGLATLYRRHIATEDQELIPLARRILDPAAIAILGREMALRRGLDPDRVGVSDAGAPSPPPRRGRRRTRT